MILLLLLLPLFIGFVFINSNLIKKKNHLQIFSILLSGYCFLYSLLLLILFNTQVLFYQFITLIPNFIFKFLENYYIFGLDSLALIFIILTTFLVFLCILYVQEETDLRNFISIIFSIEFFLIILFSTLDLFIFFVVFELILIPVFLLIFNAGPKPKKTRAGNLLLYYTILSSILFVVALLLIFQCTGTFNYEYIQNISFDKTTEQFIWVAFFLAFAAKVPMFPMHIWLPEAHVEAPTVGSVLLAGILLKIGIFGIIRYNILLFPETSHYFSDIIQYISTFGVILSSLVVIRQTDLKKALAYSSIAHMNLILVGLFTNNINGIYGAIIQSIGHGLVASALFFIVGILYHKFNTRSMTELSGSMILLPILSTFYLYFSLSNIAFPGTSNFIGEFLLLCSIFEYNIFLNLICSLSVILSALYTLWLTNRVLYTNNKLQEKLLVFDVNLNEFTILFLLLITSLYIGTHGDFLTQYINLYDFKLIYINL